MPISQPKFDPIAIAVDWLDAGRLGDLDGLLDLHDERATLECACEGVTLTGREALSAYWASKLDSPTEAAFTVADMILTDGGVRIDYQNHEGKSVRIHFRFTPSRKNRAGKLRSVGMCRLGSYICAG